MELLDAIRNRRAVRAYAARPVTRVTVQGLIDTAILAPSAMNRQAWAFTIVGDRALLDRVSENAKRHMLAAIEPGSHLAALRDRLASPEFNIFYTAPIAVVISATAPDAFATYDCCLAASSFMLAAYGAGLGSCWIGMAEDWLNTPEGKTLLRIPRAHRPIATIILGYPQTAAQPTPRNQPPVSWIGVA